MAALVVPRVKLTGPASEGETPFQFLTKLDQADQILAAAVGEDRARISVLEARASPAGTFLGAVPLVWTYSPNAGVPSAAVPRTPTAVIPGIGPDQDGKVASTWISNTRLGVVSFDALSPLVPNFRSSFLDVAGPGGVTLAGSGTFGVTQGGGSNTIQTIFGAVAVGANTLRTSVYWYNNTSIHYNLIVTSNFDGAAVASSVDFNGNSGTSVSSFTSGYMYRKRGWLVGLFGALIVRPGGIANEGSNAPCVSSNVIERQASSLNSRRVLSSPLGTGQFAIDPIAYGLFAKLTDALQVGISGFQAGLTLSPVSDRTGGEIGDGLPLGNALSGNPRLACVSGSLVVLGFMTGSQYNTYAVSRTPGNELALIGAFSPLGALGTVPLEILKLRATRFMQVVKGGGASVTIHVYDVNVGATLNTSPFTLVASLPFNLGQDLAGATTGDAVTVMDVTQPPDNPDRVVFTFRNAARGLNGVQAVDIVYPGA